MEIEEVRKKITISNIVILILSLVAILSYFILPLYQIRLSTTLSKDIWEDGYDSFFKQYAIEQNLFFHESEENNNINESEMLDYLNQAVVNELEKGDITVSWSPITLSTSDLLSLAFSTPEGLYQLLYTNLKQNYEDAEAFIDILLQRFIPMYLSEWFRANYYVLSEADKAALHQAGLTEDYLTSSISRIVDSLAFKKTKATDFVDLYFTTYADIYQKASALQLTDNFIINNNMFNFEFDIFESEEATAEAKSQLLDSLMNSAFVDENGYLLSDRMKEAFIADIITLPIPEEILYNPENIVKEYVINCIIFIFFDNSLGLIDEDAYNTYTGDKYDFKKVILHGIESYFANSVLLKIIFIVIALSVFIPLLTWFVLAIKILFKFKAENNSVRMGAPIWFGSNHAWLCIIPQILFTPPVLSNILSNSLTYFDPALLASIPTSFGGFEGLQIFFISGSLVSFAIGVFLTFFCWFYYGRKRKELKRLLRD